ncbi:alpha/beta-hydrolase [Ramaria rubella]|nr:alpha/beta-hydrolase [Ramaria rubella]
MPSDVPRRASSERSGRSTPESSKTSISARLSSLFSDSPQRSRPGSPADDVTAETVAGNMTPPKLRIPKPSSMASTSKLRMPVVRWLGRKPSECPEVISEPGFDHDTGDPAVALQQAISDRLPIEPDPVRTRSIPSHNPFMASNTFRSPMLMNSLARSTLPTYSPSSCDAEATSDLPILVSQSPPTRTSVDSLRVLRDRGIHTSASQNEPSRTSPTRSWFRWENKQSVDQLLEAEDRADTVKGEEEHIRRKYRSPRDPIVFCHGLLGFDSIPLGPSFAPVEVSHWRGIKEVLEANGVEVLITRVPATSSIDDRANVLEQKVSEVYPGREVHLIGHSMGGLDCRYLTTHLRHSKFKVRSITTIATPHRGSAFADHFIQTIGRDRLPSVISLLDMLPNGGGDGKAFESLTVERMRQFNEETPDVEGVKYFSWGATYEPGLIDTWRWPHSVVLEKEGPNDGLVSVESSKWGVYLGTLDNVSHLDLVGWINTARYKWAALTGREIAFKPATFYLGVADHLARAVEGQEPELQAENRDNDEDGVDTSVSTEPNRSCEGLEGGESHHEDSGILQKQRNTINST